MFGLEFSIDPKLSAAIERRRAAEEQRRRRILDDKTRRIGIDVQALNQQMRDRLKLKNIDERQQNEIENEMIDHDRKAVEADDRAKQQRRRLDREVDHFRKVCQRPETQRDFDLNDPESLKKSRPPRDDERGGSLAKCGPASLQKFEGEDLRKDERDRKLREMQRVWLERQMQEHADLERKAREEKEMLDAQTRELAMAARAQSQSQEEHKRRLDTAIQNYNLKLMEHQQAEKRLSRRLELECDIVDLESHIFSDILAEDPSVARTSLLGPSRVVADRWKGMTAEELDVIMRSQREQVVEKQYIENVKRRVDEDWDRQILGAARDGVIKERQQCRAARERDRLVAEENRRLAEEQRSIQQHLNRNVYRSVIASDDFFDGFGKSCR